MISWQLTKHSLTHPTPVEKFERIEFPKPEIPEVKQEIAPYNGFGSVEDSLASCLNLIPKAPRRYPKILFEDIVIEYFPLSWQRLY